MSLDSDHERLIKQAITAVVHEQTGMHETLAVPIAERVFDGLIERFGQERVYFTRSVRARRDAVRAEYDGNNRDRLMRRHKISRATFYRYVEGLD